MGNLIGVGSALVDQLAYVPEAFLEGVPGGKGGMELVDWPAMTALLGQLPEAPTRVPGGSAANTAVAAARLGLHTGLLTKVGSDEVGDYYRSAAHAAGVDTGQFKINPDVPTGTCLSLVTPDSQRTMRTYLGAAATLLPGEVSSADFAGYSHAHIEGYMLFNEELMRHILSCARQAGCQIALDLAAPEVVRATLDLLPELLRTYVDIVFANEDEAAAFSGSDDPRTGLDALAEHCPLAAVKLGARGAIVRRGCDTVTIPALTVPARDTTGAGDYWAAGFLFGLLNDMTLPAAGALGALLGAEVVQVTGADLPETTWERIRSALAHAPTRNNSLTDNG